MPRNVFIFSEFIYGISAEIALRSNVQISFYSNVFSDPLQSRIESKNLTKVLFSKTQYMSLEKRFKFPLYNFITFH